MIQQNCIEIRQDARSGTVNRTATRSTSRRNRSGSDQTAQQISWRRAGHCRPQLKVPGTKWVPVRGVRTLLKLNQQGGFDCPGCAWPEPDGERSHAEFCENGAKHVADEATTKRVTPEFFQKVERRRSFLQIRLLAGQTGTHYSSDGAARGRHALRSHQLGRRV